MSKKISIKSMKFYKTLEPVLKLKGKYITAQDYQYTDKKEDTLKTVKQYNIINNIDDFETVVKTNNNLYELIPEDKHLRLYFDLEIEEELTEEEETERLQIFIKWIKEQFEKSFNKSIEDNYIIILKSSKKNKMSYHIVIQKYYFSDCYNLKNWIDYLMSVINASELTEELEKLVWSKNENKKFIMDSAPYGKNRCFRLVNQSKIGSNVCLKLITKHTIKDTFITLDEIKNDDSLLTFEKQIFKPLKKASIQKESKTLHLNKSFEDDFINNDNCLMNLYKMDYKSLGDIPLWKQYLFLIPNNCISWDNWIKIGYAIRFCGGVKNDWIEYSKLSKNYIIGECDSFEKFFIKGAQGFGLEKKCYNTNTLRNIAKIAHPQFFKKKQECFFSLFDMDLNGVNVIEEKSTFLSQEGTSDEKNILNDDKMNILYAFLGKGKTTAIKRLIKEMNYKTVLCLSPRQAFAQFLSADFEFNCYLDGNYNSDKLVISVESLYKIDSNKKYELLVIDESESILNQFSSPTMKGRYLEIYAVLINIIKNCKKVICADAFISNRTINFIKSFDEKITMIKNNTLPIQRKAVEIEKDDFNKYLIDDIKQKNKNYVCFSTKSGLTEFKSALKTHETDFYDKSISYYGKGDDDVFEGLKNINETWTEASIVLTSPSITVGNSYSVIDHFNKVFINGAPTCTVRDTFQTQMRVRHLKDNMLVFSLPTKKQYNYAKSRNLLYFNVLDDFDKYNEGKKEMTINSVIEILISESNDKKIETLNLLKEKIEKLEQTPKALREILFFNLLEYSISNTYYNDLFYHYLDKCGYHLMTDKKTFESEKKKNEEEDNNFNYDEIERIEPEEALYIAELEKAKKATEIQKLQKDKFYFEKIVDTTYEGYSDFFETYYLKGSNRQFFDNARMEFKNNIVQIMKNDLYNCGDVIEQHALKSIQLKYMTELNKALDIKNSFDSFEISVERIKGLSMYLKMHRKNIHDAFRMRDRSSTDITPENELNLNIKFLTKIYKDWSNTEFKAIKDSKHKGAIIKTYSKNGTDGLFHIFKKPEHKEIIVEVL